MRAYKEADKNVKRRQQGAMVSRPPVSSVVVDSDVMNRVRERVKSTAQNTWENMGDAASSYSAAKTASANQTRDTAATAAKSMWTGAGVQQSARASSYRSTGDTVVSAAKEPAQKAWRSVGDTSTKLSEANYALEQAKVQLGRDTWNSTSDVQSKYSHAQQAMGEKRYQAGKDYFDTYGKQLYETSGVTGSDQTTASFYGYQNDTSWKKPTEKWNSGELQLYNIYLQVEPERAEEYAAQVNNRYNQREFNRNIEKIQNWTSQDFGHGVGAWTAARAANLVSGLDSYNKHLEYAATGRNNVSPEVSFSDIRDAVDDGNAEKLSERYGEKAGNLYRFGTDIADATISRGVNYGRLGKVGSADITIDDALAVINGFNEEYIKSIDLGGKSAAVNGTIGSALEGVAWATPEALELAYKNLPEKITEKISPNLVKNGKNFVGDLVGVVTAGSREWFAYNKEKIDALTQHYMAEEKISESTARWKATKDLLEQATK